jgi:hypothetical protein
LLDGMGCDCERVVGVLVQEFEDLAARVQKVLQLADLTARSIDSAALPTIPAKVENLIKRTEGFVRERLEADAAMLDAARSQEKLVDRLMDLNAGNRSIVQEIRVLSLLTSMEVARLGQSGAGFEYLVRELQSASENISSAAREFAHRAQQRNRTMHETQRKISAALPRLRQQFVPSKASLRACLGR